MYTNRVFGTAKCVLFIKVSSFQDVLNDYTTCIYTAYMNTPDGLLRLPMGTNTGDDVTDIYSLVIHTTGYRSQNLLLKPV